MSDEALGSMDPNPTRDEWRIVDSYSTGGAVPSAWRALGPWRPTEAEALADAARGAAMPVEAPGPGSAPGGLPQLSGQQLRVLRSLATKTPAGEWTSLTRGLSRTVEALLQHGYVEVRGTELMVQGRRDYICRPTEAGRAALPALETASVRLRSLAAREALQELVRRIPEGVLDALAPEELHVGLECSRAELARALPILRRHGLAAPVGLNKWYPTPKGRDWLARGPS